MRAALRLRIASDEDAQCEKGASGLRQQHRVWGHDSVMAGREPPCHHYDMVQWGEEVEGTDGEMQSVAPRDFATLLGVGRVGEEGEEHSVGAPKYTGQRRIRDVPCRQGKGLGGSCWKVMMLVLLITATALASCPGTLGCGGKVCICMTNNMALEVSSITIIAMHCSHLHDCMQARVSSFSAFAFSFEIFFKRFIQWPPPPC